MQTNRFFGSILLIAGTSIGAGMLALPVVTAAYGFFPSIFLFVLCWLGMMLCGLLLLEVNLWLKPGANIVSMARQTLGPMGKLVAWITYLLLFYSVMAAYVSGIGDIVHTTASSVFHFNISIGSGSLLLVIAIGIAVFLGMHSVDYVNRLFFFGKVITYIAVIAVIAPFVQVSHLTDVNIDKLWLTLPVIMTSFAFQNTIPGLRVYLNEDVKKLRLAIIIGSTLPLLIYLIWEFVIVGVIPAEGTHGLLSIMASGQPVSGLSDSLNYVLQNNWISSLFKTFTLCAIVTSFIGVSFSLFYFFMDSFNIKNNRQGRVLTLALTFVPPVIFAFFYPDGFIFALSFAGIFVAVLLGIMPVLMVWSGRYWKRIATGYQPRINRVMMVLLIVFFLVVIGGQLAGQ